jgi:hypothetical protein
MLPHAQQVDKLKYNKRSIYKDAYLFRFFKVTLIDITIFLLGVLNQNGQVLRVRQIVISTYYPRLARRLFLPLRS